MQEKFIRKRIQDRDVLSTIREEFGTELIGDYNAVKMYEVVQNANHSKTDQKK